MIEIQDKVDCCGCSACSQACPVKCIRMTPDEEGFCYPTIDTSVCINCHRCENVCPIINIKHSSVSEPPKTLACINHDDKIRHSSSSGGVFYSLAKKVLDDKGVVFGAMFDAQWNVVHNFIDREKDISKLQGSKYVQSEIQSSYKKAKDFLKNGRTVLFSGTPCQIAGLKFFLGRDYNNLILVEVICHGVPSPLIWRMYLSKQLSLFNRQLQMEALAISSINFRDKSEMGWKNFGLSYLLCGGIRGKDNITRCFETHNKNPYLRAFIRNLTLRPCCYECHFKSFVNQADYALADLWGTEHFFPKNDDKGVSLVYTFRDPLKLSEDPKIQSVLIDYSKSYMSNPAVHQS